MPKVKDADPKIIELLETIDLDKVSEAITTVRPGQKPLADYDAEDARAMVWNALERWLLGDVADMLVTHVEQKIWVPIPGAGTVLVGVVDVHGQIKGVLKETAPFSGGRIIVDWKTTGGALDTVWKNRMMDSWQWRIYAYIMGAKLFAYRGISRAGETRNLLLEIPETNDQEVVEYLSGASRMYGTLLKSQLPVWPRHMPFACKAYGRECPFYTECQEYTMPQKAVTGIEAELSYSKLERFLLCPEKARRHLIEDGVEDTEETMFGESVHRGLACAYKQVAENFMEGLYKGSTV